MKSSRIQISLFVFLVLIAWPGDVDEFVLIHPVEQDYVDTWPTEPHRCAERPDRVRVQRRISTCSNEARRIVLLEGDRGHGLNDS